MRTCPVCAREVPLLRPRIPVSISSAFITAVPLTVIVQQSPPSFLFRSLCRTCLRQAVREALRKLEEQP